MKNKEITAKEYADFVGCSEQNITKHIRNENWEYLPYVIKVKRFSRFVVLVVPDGFSKNSFKGLVPKEISDNDS